MGQGTKDDLGVGQGFSSSQSIRLTWGESRDHWDDTLLTKRADWDSVGGEPLSSC